MEIRSAWSRLVLEPIARCDKDGTQVSDAKPIRRRLRRALEFAIGPVLLFLIWWFAYKGGLINGDLVPSPVATLHDTFANISSGKMTRDFSRTLVRVLYSIVIAIVFGVPVG